jgi:hypothetical protein
MWTMTEYTDITTTIDFPSIHVALPVRIIYEELELSEEPDSAPITLSKT